MWRTVIGQGVCSYLYMVCQYMYINTHKALQWCSDHSLGEKSGPSEIETPHKWESANIDRKSDATAQESSIKPSPYVLSVLITGVWTHAEIHTLPPRTNQLMHWLIYQDQLQLQVSVVFVACFLNDHWKNPEFVNQLLLIGLNLFIYLLIHSFIHSFIN